MRGRRPAVWGLPCGIAVVTPRVTPMASLCPGYKHVEAFGPDDEYEDEDDDSQVEYVTLDMGSIEPTLVPSSSTYRLIVRCFFGLGDPHPRADAVEERASTRPRRSCSFLGLFSRAVMILS